MPVAINDPFVTLITFTYTHEYPVLKGKLETEGIECVVQDEMTASASPFYSNAIGGIKLKVRESQLPLALELLDEAGYYSDPSMNDIRRNENNDIAFGVNDYATQASEKIKAAIPALTLPRLAMGVALLIVAALALYWFTRQSAAGVLVNNNWCIDGILYQGQVYSPESKVNVILEISGDCTLQKIIFENNGILSVPGFATPPETGKWKILDGRLVITGITTYGHIYNGNYRIDLNGDRLTLVSPVSTIYCIRRNMVTGSLEFINDGQ